MGYMSVKDENFPRLLGVLRGKKKQVGVRQRIPSSQSLKDLAAEVPGWIFSFFRLSKAAFGSASWKLCRRSHPQRPSTP